MEMHKKIDVTIDEAREWYDSGNKTLKDLALKVFSEDELNQSTYSEIKTFEDACNALYMNLPLVDRTIREISKTSRAMVAMYKLNIVRNALNFGQDLHFTENKEDSYAYFPRNLFVTESSTFFERQINLGNIDVIGKIKVEGEKYNVLCSCPCHDIGDGFGDFNSENGVGYASAGLAFLGCANKKIAKHFGKYFGVLILEAKYGDMFDFEVIEDKYGNA